VTENLEALPSIFRSVRAFAGGKPYWVFPTAIAMRDNPYGAAPAENPNNIRQAMNRVDPRERALLGAAWYGGYLAHAARAGVDAVTLAAAAGPSGIVYTRQSHSQPWFDAAGAQVMPHYHVLAGLAALAGAEAIAVSTSDARHVQGLAAQRDGARTLWLVYLSGTSRTVRIDGISGSGRARLLDEESFEEICMITSLAGRGVDLVAQRIKLGPYAVAEVSCE
jgi:D-apionolactonase